MNYDFKTVHNTIQSIPLNNFVIQFQFSEQWPRDIVEMLLQRVSQAMGFTICHLLNGSSTHHTTQSQR